VNTDRLIDLLSANLEPVSPGRFGKRMILAIFASGVAALVLMLRTIGPRPGLSSAAHLKWTALKLLFALSVIGAGAPFLIRSMCPGMEKRTRLALVFSPFLAALIVALLMLLLVRPEAWMEMLLGVTATSYQRCFLCVLSFAAIPFATLMWVLRKGAPTSLRLSGALAGIVAGGVGAAAYALHCNSDTIPFVAIWYSAAILCSAAIGAQLGPWLLRW
jgi:hypothetical protein